jgi:hypothetical protein
MIYLCLCHPPGAGHHPELVEGQRHVNQLRSKKNVSLRNTIKGIQSKSLKANRCFDREPAELVRKTNIKENFICTEKQFHMPFRASMPSR